MSKGSAIDNLIGIINSQNAWYLGLISLMVAIVAIFAVYTGYQQKRISDQQVKKFDDSVTKVEEALTSQKELTSTLLSFTIKTLPNGMNGEVGNFGDKVRFYKSAKKLIESNEMSSSERGKLLTDAQSYLAAELRKVLRNQIPGNRYDPVVEGSTLAKFNGSFLEYFGKADLAIVKEVDVNMLRQLGPEVTDPEGWFKIIDLFCEVWDKPVWNSRNI